MEDQLLYSIYLCLNRVGPAHLGLELGLGEGILIKAVASSTGKSLQTVKTEVGKLGDLGKVVQISRQSQKTMIQPKPLTVMAVFKTLREIATTSGASVLKLLLIVFLCYVFY